MTESFSLTENISVILDQQLSADNLLEKKYWTSILAKLAERLGQEKFAQIDFYLVFGNQSVTIAKKSDRLVVILIADEHQVLRPNLYDGKTLIFQSYYSVERFKSQYGKIYAFPVGYNGKLDLDNPLPFAERTVNVFFSGNLHKGRRRMFDFYSYLRYFPFFLQHRLQEKFKTTYDATYPQSYIRFTNGFMRGLELKDYADYIKNSKIVLTPHGSLAEECFRHYEAIKAGCIVVSERLPENHFFSGSPIIQVDNWKDGDRIIKELLKNPCQMQELHVAGLKWWQDVMSEAAVARYMEDIIRTNQQLEYFGEVPERSC